MALLPALMNKFKLVVEVLAVAVIMGIIEIIPDSL